MRYEPVQDNEWIKPWPQLGHKIRCCDCGLVHDMDFLLDDNNDVIFRARRNQRSTGQVRRWIKYHQPTQLDLFPLI